MVWISINQLLNRKFISINYIDDHYIIRHNMECNLQMLVLWKVDEQKCQTCLLFFPNINYAINNSIYH